MQPPDDEDVQLVPKTIKIDSKKGKVKIDHAEHDVSSDEAELSSSSTCSSENDRSVRCRKGKLPGNVSDLGYDSSASSGTPHWDKELEFLPDSLKVLFEGRNIDLLDVLRHEKPDWFDPEKFKAGQEFAMNYYFGVNVAEMLSLFILFSFDDSLKPLIYTDQSGTTITSFKRYLSTVLRVKSWYEEDVFDKNSGAYNNMRIVRAMHASVKKRLDESSSSEIDARIDALNGSKRFVCTLTSAIEEDFKASLCPFVREHNFKNLGGHCRSYFNQFNMTTTQFAFLGLMLLYPERFGASKVTDRELEGFIHLWRVLGYLLGIEDKYNFCNGSLSEVKMRSKDLIDYWVVPNFTRLSLEWEHFSRCMAKGVTFYMRVITFESMFMYLCDTIKVDARNLFKKVTWSSYFKYGVIKFTLCCALRFQCLVNLVNKSLRRSLFRAKNYSDDKIYLLAQLRDGLQ